jgi:tetratricopeptide (TPR) repeat protein
MNGWDAWHPVAAQRPVWVVARGTAARATAAEAILTRPRTGELVTVDCEGTLGSPFQPLRTWLRGALPELELRAAAGVEETASEIGWLLPEVRDREPFAAAPALDSVAVTPSERRLHKESEQLHRLTGAFSLLLATAAGPGGLVWFRGLDEADWPTLLTYHRLAGRRHAAATALAATLREAPTGDPEPGGDAPRPAEDGATAGVRLLWRVRWASGPAVIQVPDDPEPACARDRLRPARERDAEYDPVRLEAELGVDDAEVATFRRQALEVDHNVLRRARPLAGLGFEEALRLALLWSRAGDANRALTYGLRALNQSFFALDHELTLAVGAELLTAGAGAAADLRRAVWKAMGVAYAFLKEYGRSMACYERALGLSEDPADRAQVLMYLALLRVKRLGDLEGAETLVLEGFRLLEGAEGRRALLERGWLSNVRALIKLRGGAWAEAMGLVRPALAVMKEQHDSEATHLKINLISNVSVLFELHGDMAQSLRVNSLFEGIARQAGDLFTKAHRYREAGLYLKAGDLERALATYGVAYRVTERQRDRFHQEAIARALATVQVRQGAWAEAARWYRASAELRRNLVGDREMEPYSQAGLGLCLRAAGAAGEARAALDDAERLAAANGQAHLLEALLALAKGGEAEAEALLALLAKRDQPDYTKLDRPFYLMNAGDLEPTKRSPETPKTPPRAAMLGLERG